MAELPQLLNASGGIALFRGLPRESAAAALQGSTLRNLRAGETLLRPGESNNYIYILLSGELSAYLDAHNQDSTAIPIRAGECVGELSVLDGKPTSALVVAVSDCELLQLPGDLFRSQVLTLNGVSGNLLLALAERMRKANAAALKTQREQLELRHLRKELQAARQLQLDMIPPQLASLFPQRDDIDVSVFMEPAPAVAGNFCDCFFADRHHLFFCVGDASGRGMAAALSMSRAVGVVRRLARDFVMDPSGLLSAANTRLCDANNARVFVSALCGFVDVRTGAVRYSNAGHCAPLLAWSGGSKPLPVAKGSLLGAVPDMSYLDCDITLARGDLLLCHSIGVTEALNAAQQEFGEGRLLELAARGYQEPLSSLLAQIRAQLEAFVAGTPPEDDCTLLALRYGARIEGSSIR